MAPRDVGPLVRVLCSTVYCGGLRFIPVHVNRHRNLIMCTVYFSEQKRMISVTVADRSGCLMLRAGFGDSRDHSFA